MLGCEHAGPEDIEKAVHCASDALVKNPNWMMKAGRKLDWHSVSHSRDERPRDLRPARKGICGYTASAEFETGAAARERLDRRGGGIGRSFPKDIQGQIAEGSAGYA